jgi:hypothetical protein
MDITCNIHLSRTANRAGTREATRESESAAFNPRTRLAVDDLSDCGEPRAMSPGAARADSTKLVMPLVPRLPADGPDRGRRRLQRPPEATPRKSRRRATPLLTFYKKATGIEGVTTVETTSDDAQRSKPHGISSSRRSIISSFRRSWRTRHATYFHRGSASRRRSSCSGFRSTPARRSRSARRPRPPTSKTPIGRQQRFFDSGLVAMGTIGRFYRGQVAIRSGAYRQTELSELMLRLFAGLVRPPNPLDQISHRQIDIHEVETPVLQARSVDNKIAGDVIGTRARGGLGKYRNSEVGRRRVVGAMNLRDARQRDTRCVKRLGEGRPSRISQRLADQVGFVRREPIRADLWTGLWDRRTRSPCPAFSNG